MIIIIIIIINIMFFRKEVSCKLLKLPLHCSKSLDFQETWPFFVFFFLSQYKHVIVFIDITFYENTGAMRYKYMYYCCQFEEQHVISLAF